MAISSIASLASAVVRSSTYSGASTNTTTGPEQARHRHHGGGGKLMESVKSALASIGIDLGSTTKAASESSETNEAGETSETGESNAGDKNQVVRTFMKALFDATGGGGRPQGPPPGGGQPPNGPPPTGGYGGDMATKLKSLAAQLTSGISDASGSISALKSAFGDLVGAGTADSAQGNLISTAA